MKNKYEIRSKKFYMCDSRQSLKLFEGCLVDVQSLFRVKIILEFGFSSLKSNQIGANLKLSCSKNLTFFLQKKYQFFFSYFSPHRQSGFSWSRNETTVTFDPAKLFLKMLKIESNLDANLLRNTANKRFMQKFLLIIFWMRYQELLTSVSLAPK